MNKVIRSDGRIPIKKGLWCPLRKMYFPKIFAFVGGDPSEDDTPISCLYTLDPRAVSLIEGVGVVPIDRIDETCQQHNRAKSLILRASCKIIWNASHNPFQIEAMYLESIRRFSRQYSKIVRFTVRNYFSIVSILSS